jgi:hypothetical protein
MSGKLGLVKFEFFAQGHEFLGAWLAGDLDGGKRAVTSETFGQQCTGRFGRKHPAIDEQIIGAAGTCLHASGQSNDRNAVLHYQFQTASGSLLKDSMSVADTHDSNGLMIMLQLRDTQHDFQFRRAVPLGVVWRPRRIFDYSDARLRRQRTGGENGGCNEAKYKPQHTSVKAPAMPPNEISPVWSMNIFHRNRRGHKKTGPLVDRF